MDIADLPTPALLLERAVLKRNIQAMAARASRLGVALRPHVKTHKCVEVARLQVEAGATGLTVSTLPEAEAFAAAGFADLTWALPLPLPQLGAALDLARRITFRLLIDDEETLGQLEAAARAAGCRPHVWLKVDCGYHRAGVDPLHPSASALARRLSTSTAVEFDGLLTHAGHAYAVPGLEGRRQVAREERDVLTCFAASLRQDGIRVPALSLGSTPTLTAADDLAGIDEARPGNYAYFDLTQVALGSCVTGDVAVSVLATVISHPAGATRAVVDAGALALSKDPGRAEPGAGLGGICPDPSATAPDVDLRLVSLSQEHGVIHSRTSLDGKLPVGARLRILPQHSCLSSACFDRVHVVEGGKVTDVWTVHRQR